MNQAIFAAALLQPANGCPPGLAAWNSSDPAVRFDVYRNNVIVSLISALRDTFAVTCALAGKEFFNAMAREFVSTHPPHSPLLSTYGTVTPNFSSFIAAYAPAQSIRYLSDVAKLEAQRVVSYHAQDADAVSTERIAALLGDIDRLNDLRFTLHPSLAVVRSSYAIVSLWAAHQDILSLSEINPFTPEDALIFRDQLSVRIVHLAPGDADFIYKLLEGAPIAPAAEYALAQSQQFDLPVALSVLIRYNVIADL